MNCPITGLCVKSLLIATIAGFAFIFGYDYVVHVILLMDQYIATGDLWRDQETIKSLMHWTTISQGAIAFFFAVAYGKFVVCRQLDKSLIFGGLVGLIMGFGAFTMYTYSPIPMSMALAWLGAETLKGLGLGVVNKFVFGCKKACGKDDGEAVQGD